MNREKKERRHPCRSSCALIPIFSVLRALDDQEVTGSEDPGLSAYSNALLYTAVSQSLCLFNPSTSCMLEHFLEKMPRSFEAP